MGTPPTWTLIEIVTHTDAVEAASYALGELGAIGVTSRQDGNDIETTRVRLSAYFPPDGDPYQLVISVRDCLDRLGKAGLSTEPGYVSSRTIIAENWTTSWRSFFPPQRFGDRLMITPSWEPIPDAAPQAVVILDPGMAFGTGAHASTQLVLRFLAELPIAGRRVADIGTGSGILAIAAVKLGASVVVAVDTDLSAIRVADENVRRNRITESVLLSVGTLDAVTGEYELLLMNILARVIVPVLPDIRRRLAPDGLAILSGITDSEASSVRAALDECGYDTLACVTTEGWTAFMVRPNRTESSV
jgi:ribosomal protein L11 methyltransferase